MEESRPELDGTSVVLLGNFNPSIFQPAWLGAHDLIRREEAEGASVAVISPQLTSFSAGGWLALQVLLDRFTASTSDPGYFEVLRDLVVGIFKVLEHTPFHTMGINRDMHFRMHSQ